MFFNIFSFLLFHTLRLGLFATRFFADMIVIATKQKKNSKRFRITLIERVIMHKMKVNNSLQTIILKGKETTKFRWQFTVVSLLSHWNKHNWPLSFFITFACWFPRDFCIQTKKQQILQSMWCDIICCAVYVYMRYFIYFFFFEFSLIQFVPQTTQFLFNLRF